MEHELPEQGDQLLHDRLPDHDGVVHQRQHRQEHEVGLVVEGDLPQVRLELTRQALPLLGGGPAHDDGRRLGARPGVHDVQEVLAGERVGHLAQAGGGGDLEVLPQGHVHG